MRERGAMIGKELEIKIRLHFYRDHWPVGTIATNLGVHRDTVKRCLGLDRRKSGSTRARRKEIDTYESFVRQTLSDYPKLRATRLFEMLRNRGYRGSVYPVRRLMRHIRPSLRQAYLDLHFTPGEQAQVDWAHFGKISYGKNLRPLQCFVMVLSHSRAIYARMFHDMKSARVLEGHVLAFDHFQGTPRTVLYDNMKTAVIENMGAGVRFQSDLLELATHYNFMPRACNPRAGWEKGRVERAIRYLRENFFAARTFTSLSDLNDQLASWLQVTAQQRDWPEDRQRTVKDAFDSEELTPLPNDAFDPYEEVIARVSKKAMIQFDCNQYPVDPECVGQMLTVRATHDCLRILNQEREIHRYERLWGRDHVATLPGHQERIAKLRSIKKHRAGRHALERTLPSGRALLKAWSDLGESLAHGAREVLELVPSYGVDTVEQAAQQALAQGTPRSCSIAYLLSQQKASIPINTQVHLRSEVADIDVVSQPTASYDDLYAET